MVNVKDLLAYIDPATCSYQEWINVGMALKAEGCTAADWDTWSRADSRYKSGECFRKWGSFQRSDGDDIVTGGTIYEMARRGGYSPELDVGAPLDWDDYISDEGVIVDPGWIEPTEVAEPDNWDPVHELITYLQTIFLGSDYVGYVTEVYENDDRLSPKKGVWDRTAGQLIEELQKCHGDIGAVIGDTNPKAGAWIRFNPVDGQGVKNDNITEFRYALVESDKIDLGKQEAIMRQLELPIAAMVHSGKKSIHAIVRIEATDYQEYKKRVEYLYQICNKNGLVVDTQNKNPSRLSRMPGVIRDGHKQYLIATNIGKKSWQEWAEWIEAVNDDLPDPEGLTSVWDDLPPLSECLIDGILRLGHKMLVVGPSKAGKSFLLIELVISIAEGRKWLGRQCKQGRVLYVNLELDRASCLHRFKDVYQAMGIKPEHIDNIDIWNLRGKSLPMDKLAPKLIRRAEKKGYTAIIIDPIYKIITGDENSASEMANFCNQFDKVCTALHCAVIYCHHHSKGLQGQKKSMDRASGSGVFARDPDAMLDMTELTLSDALKVQLQGRARCEKIAEIMDSMSPGWRDEAGQDDMLSPSSMTNLMMSRIDIEEQKRIEPVIREAEESAAKATAWRIEGILREFPIIDPINFFFQYPIHRRDESGALKDLTPEAAMLQGGRDKRGEQQKVRTDKQLAMVRRAYNEITETTGHPYAEIDEIVDYIKLHDPNLLGKDPCRNVKSWLKKINDMYMKKEMVFAAGMNFDDEIEADD